MFRADRQQTHAPTSFPAAMSSSSLSSSFSSSASSSMLHHAASPANSSHSDVLTSDQSGALPLSTPTKTHFQSAAVSPAPRSSSLGAMGQTYSRPQPAAPSAPPPSLALNPPTTTSKGFKLKNAFGARRKQSEDSSPISLSLSRTRSKGKGRKTDDASITSPPETDQPSARRPLRAKQLTLQFASAFSGKQTVSAPTSPALPPPPPSPPPKPTGLKAGKTYVPPGMPVADNRRSVVVPSPGIVAALQYMQNAESSADTEMSQQSEVHKKDREKAEMKEVWRQSDSNMSFNTIRPGAATVGNRTSRPVSMAESLHSTHTIVPVNKRLSALVTDADFVMTEESGQEISSSSAPVSGKASPSGSVKSRNRRSASLILSSPFPKAKTPSSASVSAVDDEPKPKPRPRPSAEIPQLSPSLSTKETPTLTRAAVSGYIAPMASGAAVPSTGNNIRGRLAAWSPATNDTSSPSRPERHLPDIPSQHQRIHPNERTASSTMRQTAVSITSSFSAGLAKRAVEKMGRALGGMHTGSGSGYSSSSSTHTAPSSFSDPSAEDLGRLNTTQSPSKYFATTPGHIGKGKQRRTPNAPSGAWSVASSTTSSSFSDSDAYSVPAGPVLGKCMRGPTRSTGGGAVFGRDLRGCVAETALPASSSAPIGNVIGRPPHSRTASGSKAQKEQDNKELEARRLPALVVRCAQHILAWGVQEEGLFRLTGRPSHMSKIRSEFDTGADYDLSECNVGDLDPHAVSSVFKAYLRELPEPILTHALMPYFEAVLSAESHSRESQGTPQTARGMRGPDSKTGGNVPAMRKPPSLSTLAMPNFSGMRAPSESLVNALRSLIAGLPQENRDLLHTVTDLISATAKRSKETKMPLSNLLLVFCPSLNMNPPLLRVLCEAEGIWDVPPSPLRQPVIMDTKRERTMMDTGPDESPSTDTESTSDEVVTSARSSSANREISLEISRTAVAQSNLDTAKTQYRPERSPSPAYGPRPLPRAPLEARRGPVATLYLDSECADDLVSESFTALPAAEFLPSGVTSSDSPSSNDDTSIGGGSNSVAPALPSPYSPPSLSSSTDSLTSSETPSSSHLPPSEDHLDKAEVSLHLRTPVIVDPADLALPRTPRRSATCPAMGGDVQFPSPANPPTPTLFRRPSVPKLSLTGSTPQLHGPASAAPSLRTRRIKKPSLHLLFTRRSSASLHSPSNTPVSTSTPAPYLQAPYSASPLSSPLSAQQSMYTAQTSTSSLPPVLDMTIETSPLKMGMGIDVDKRRTIGAKPSSSHSNHTVTGPETDELPLSPSTATPAPNETPIASLYSTPSSSVLSFDANTNTQPLRPRRRSRKSQISLASSSFNHLSVVLPDEETAEDGWAQSVLAAADTDGSWSARNVMKFFGGGS